MRQIATSLGEARVTIEGSGPHDVVLLHANPGDHRDFDDVLPAIADHHTTYAVDWPGYQAKANHPREATAMAFAAVLPEILDALGLERAVLLGNSVGGYAAARLAIDDPSRVTALILVNSGGFSPGDPFTRSFTRLMGTETLTRLLAGRLPRLYLRNRTTTTRAMIARDAARRSDPDTTALQAAIWRSFNAPAHDLRTRATAIQVPTLLAWGVRDPLLGRDGRTARRVIPNATWHPLPTGHAPFAEAPDLFLDALLPFLHALEEGVSSSEESVRR